MIPRREEDVETTPLSPRVSDVSDESAYLRGEDYLESPASEASQWAEGQKKGLWTSKVRHAVGIALLLATVLLWTASNFLASVRISHPLGWHGSGKRIADNGTDNIRRRLLLETLPCNLRKHNILRHPSPTHVPPPPMGRPSPSQQRAAAPPTSPSTRTRPLATASREMEAPPRTRDPLFNLSLEQSSQ